MENSEWDRLVAIPEPFCIIHQLTSGTMAFVVLVPKLPDSLEQRALIYLATKVPNMSHSCTCLQGMGLKWSGPGPEPPSPSQKRASPPTPHPVPCALLNEAPVPTRSCVLSWNASA